MLEVGLDFDEQTSRQLASHKRDAVSLGLWGVRSNLSPKNAYIDIQALIRQNRVVVVTLDSLVFGLHPTLRKGHDFQPVGRVPCIL